MTKNWGANLYNLAPCWARRSRMLLLYQLLILTININNIIVYITSNSPIFCYAFVLRQGQKTIKIKSMQIMGSQYLPIILNA